MSHIWWHLCKRVTRPIVSTMSGESGPSWGPATPFAGLNAGALWLPFMQYEGQQILYQDNAFTTPVTAVDQPVNSMRDASGNGIDIISKGAGDSFLRTNGSKFWLEIPSNADWQTLVNCTWMDNNPYFVACGLRYGSTGGNKYWFGTSGRNGVSDDARVHIGQRDAQTGTQAHWFNDADFPYVPQTATPEVHSARYLNPGCDYRANGEIVGQDAAIPSALDNVGMACIFWRDAGGNTETMSGDFYGMFLVPRDPGETEITNINNYLGSLI